MKVSSKIYRGIEYIQIAELPQEQQVKLLQEVAPKAIIKILIDKKIVSDCLQYKDYEAWFEATYQTRHVLPVEPHEKKELKLHR